MRATYLWYAWDPELDSPGPHEVRLTTESGASSYGQPVVVLAEGGVPIDSFSWALAWRIVAATPEELVALREAGYVVRFEEPEAG